MPPNTPSNALPLLHTDNRDHFTDIGPDSVCGAKYAKKLEMHMTVLQNIAMAVLLTLSPDLIPNPWIYLPTSILGGYFSGYVAGKVINIFSSYYIKRSIKHKLSSLNYNQFTNPEGRYKISYPLNFTLFGNKTNSNGVMLASFLTNRTEGASLQSTIKDFFSNEQHNLNRYLQSQSLIVAMWCEVVTAVASAGLYTAYFFTSLFTYAALGLSAIIAVPITGLLSPILAHYLYRRPEPATITEEEGAAAAISPA